MNQRDPHLPIPDVQSAADTRRIAIDRVGIKGIRHPVRVGSQDAVQHSIATFSLSVALPHDVKGTHMSRFVEMLENEIAPLCAAAMPGLVTRMLARLGATSGEISASFPYFIEKTAPVSAVKSLLDYEVTLTAARVDGKTDVTTKIVVPVTSLCPCSKEISAYGAHNQRSHLTIEVTGAPSLEINDIIRLADAQASSELYAILKRTDEKFVTERAYDNPKFVEDLIRDLAAALDREAQVSAYKIEAENFESIHNHSAFAVIERSQKGNLSK